MAAPSRGLRVIALFRVFAYAYLACAMGANAVVLIPQAPLGLTVTGDNALFALSWIALHAIGLAFFLAWAMKGEKALWVLWAGATYVVASVLWSPNPAGTLPYALMMVANAAFAYTCARALGTEEFLRILCRTIVALVALSLVAALVGYGQVFYLDVHDRSNIVGTTPLRGFFSHKINAGLYTAVGLLLTLTLSRGWSRTLSLALLSIFALLTGSATGLALIGLCLVAFVLLRLALRAGLSAGVVTALLLILVGPALAIVWVNLEGILGALDRDPTLTGRTLLWSWGLEAWLTRPIFGWGFDGYFLSSDAAQKAASIAAFQRYDVPHFHQSFIQTAVDLGAVGLLMLVANISVALVRNYKAAGAGSAYGFAATLVVVVLSGAAFFINVFYTYNHAATIVLLYFGIEAMRATAVAPQTLELKAGILGRGQLANPTR